MGLPAVKIVPEAVERSGYELDRQLSALGGRPEQTVAVKWLMPEFI